MDNSSPIRLCDLPDFFGQPSSSSYIQEWIKSITPSSSSATPPPTTIPPTPVITSFPDEDFHTYYVLGICLAYTLSSAPSSSSRNSSAAVSTTSSSEEDGKGKDKDIKPKGFNRVEIYNTPSSSSSGNIGSSCTSGRKKRGPTYSPPTLPITFHFPTDTIPLPPGPSPVPLPFNATSPSSHRQPHLTGPADASINEEQTEIKRSLSFEVTVNTTGKDFVQHFGEPTRKGGGNNQWISPFLEWSHLEISPLPSSSLNTSSLDITDIAKAEEAIEKKKFVIGVMVELLDPGAEEVFTDEQKRKGAGGIWDRAGGWKWGCIKIFDPNERR